LLYGVTAAAGVVLDAEGASEASLRGMLDAALEANRELSELAERQREQIALLLERDAEREAELEEARAALAVLQRMLFGRKSEKNRPEPAGGGHGAGAPAGDGPAGGGKKKNVKRGPGARAGRRDYSRLPRVEVIWDFDGGYCCPQCGEPFTGLGSDHVTEVLDWKVLVTVTAHCRRRYKRACSCPGPLTVTAPGPPRAIGKGLFSSGFIAMLLTERFAAGRSMNSLVTGLARHGAEVSAATLAGTCAQAAGLLAPLAAAIAERNRDSWHLHADETTWRVFAPGQGNGPAKWWLWVFIGADTVCFVMDPSRSGTVLARHAGLDEETGQLLPAADGGPRRLVISSGFYAVYQSAGRKADGLVNLYCTAHVRRHFVRAGDASPVQLKYWTDAWLARIRGLYAAHDELAAAWQGAAAPAPQQEQAAAARLEKAYQAWDGAITVIDEARKKQMAAPGLAEPAKKALATLDREWDGIIAHREYPMVSLDNNVAERQIRGPVVTRKNARGSHNGDTARNAAVIFTVTATAQMAGLNILTYLTAYLDECGRNGGKPLNGPALERFLPWNANPEDLRTWAQPPPYG
jgi:transposase